MHTEDSFQRHLDEHPDDHAARMVFADWLEEHGDPRAEGYRALGAMRKDCTQGGLFPRVDSEWGDECPYWGNHGESFIDSHHLPTDWFRLLDVAGKSLGDAPFWGYRTDATRRELDDAAALAFARLPAKRRAELLGLAHSF